METTTPKRSLARDAHSTFYFNSFYIRSNVGYTYFTLYIIDTSVQKYVAQNASASRKKIIDISLCVLLVLNTNTKNK